MCRQADRKADRLIKMKMKLKAILLSACTVKSTRQWTAYYTHRDMHREQKHCPSVGEKIDGNSYSIIQMPVCQTNVNDKFPIQELFIQ